MDKIWENLKYYLEKEKLMSVAHLLVMSITFLLLGLFINIIVLTQTSLKYLEEQAQITIFFKDEVTEGKILELKTSLEADERISGVEYVSKEEALRIFREINKDEPILLESVSASILPASLELKTKNIGKLQELSDEFRTVEGVEEVRFYKDVVSRFKTWSNIIYIVGFFLVAMFFVISYSVIVTALRTTIISRGQELEIMKLVGAKDSYVKNPFIYQGVFFGLVSSGIAGIVIILLGVGIGQWGIFAKGLSFGFIHGLYIHPIIFSVILAFILLISGFLLGYFGSSKAIKKYLDY